MEAREAMVSVAHGLGRGAPSNVSHSFKTLQNENGINCPLNIILLGEENQLWSVSKNQTTCMFTQNTVFKGFGYFL